MPPRFQPQNLNDIFQAAADQTKQKLPQLSHSQQVIRLYRNALKTLGSWAVDREIFVEEADKLRAEFDKHRNATPAAAAWLLQSGEDKLYSYMHPDAYKLPYMPGGSKFMRNPPPPISVCFPDGNYPPDAPLYTLNPDMSVCRPGEGRNADGTVLVDFYKKNME